MDLSTLYPKTAASEDLEKNAEAELFCKLAAQNGIDLNKLNDKEVSDLYNFTFNKVAEDESDKDEAKKDEDEKDEEEKKEAAAVEHAAKLAFAKEAQQADELGRRMAYSYVEELNKIGSALQAAAAEATQETGGGEVKEAGMPPALAKALGKVGDKVKNAPEILGGKARKLVGDMPAGKAARQATAGRSKTVGTAILGGAAAAGAGAAGAKAFGGKKKESSALDQLALEAAVKIAHDSGFDPEEAADRVTAVNTLGLQESTKVASTLDQQVEVRALEFLEAAGYPVEWAQ